MSTKLVAVLATKQELEECERIIENAMPTMIESWQAMAKIHDKKLFQATHSSFTAYLKERWPFSRQWAYKAIGKVTAKKKKRQSRGTTRSTEATTYEKNGQDESQTESEGREPGEDEAAAGDDMRPAKEAEKAHGCLIRKLDGLKLYEKHKENLRLILKDIKAWKP